MSYTFYIGDLRTGKITSRRVPYNWSWTTLIDDAGTIEVTYTLGKNAWRDVRSVVSPAKSFLVIGWVNEKGIETLLNGGPVWRTRYSDADQSLTVSAAGMWSYFDHRKVLPALVGGEDIAALTTYLQAAQLGLIAKRLVEQAQTATGGNVPVIFPSDADLGGAGTDHERTYPGYELGWVGERLKQLSEVQKGPDIQFVPQFNALDSRYIEWFMRIGTDATEGLLVQSGPEWVFDYTVPKSPIVSLDIETDGSVIGNRTFAAGEGEALGRLIATAYNADRIAAGWPLLELEHNALSNVTEEGTVQQYADADLTRGSATLETWSVSLRSRSRPYLGTYIDGDWCEIVVKDHSYIPDDAYKMRILGRSGDSTDVVQLTLSARLGTV